MRVDAMREDMAHLVRRVGRDLQRRDVTQPTAMGDLAGPIDADHRVMVGQGHDADALVGGKIGHLIRVAPAVTGGGMHVEIDEHSAKSTEAVWSLPRTHPRTE